MKTEEIERPKTGLTHTKHFFLMGVETNERFYPKRLKIRDREMFEKSPDFVDTSAFERDNHASGGVITPINDKGTIRTTYKNELVVLAFTYFKGHHRHIKLPMGKQVGDESPVETLITELHQEVSQEGVEYENEPFIFLDGNETLYSKEYPRDTPKDVSRHSADELLGIPYFIEVECLLSQMAEKQGVDRFTSKKRLSDHQIALLKFIASQAALPGVFKRYGHIIRNSDYFRYFES